MALSIKNPETEALARELAELTGESITMAINTALQEKIDKDRLLKKRKITSEKIMQFAAECAPRFPDNKTSFELIDELYDKLTGLPI